MDDSRLMKHRCDELHALIGKLKSDILAAQEHIELYSAEIEKWTAFQAELEHLRGARSEKRQPRIPKPASITERESDSERVTIPSLIGSVAQIA